MKVFKDKKTAKRFIELYDTLPEAKQKLMGKRVRKLADEKIVSDGDEFYITLEDLATIFEKLR